MTVASNERRSISTVQRMSLADYLNYNDGSDRRYELIDGIPVEMGAESDANVELAMVLMAALLAFFRPEQLRRGTEIVVPSGKSETRYPDLMVISDETRLALKEQRTRSIILPQMPPPLLVLEVVSPGDENSQNYKRDYQDKPLEYAAVGIPEYWIIDPQRSVVWVGTLTNETYRFQVFQGRDVIGSPIVPDFKLTVSQLFGLDD